MPATNEGNQFPTCNGKSRGNWSPSEVLRIVTRVFGNCTMGTSPLTQVLFLRVKSLKTTVVGLRWLTLPTLIQFGLLFLSISRFPRVATAPSMQAILLQIITDYRFLLNSLQCPIHFRLLRLPRVLTSLVDIRQPTSASMDGPQRVALPSRLEIRLATRQPSGHLRLIECPLPAISTFEMC